MSLTDWIISLGTSVIAILIAVSTYFLSKWIESVDERLKEQSQDIKDNTLKIVSLQSKQDTQAEDISSAIQTKLTAFKFPHEQVDKIEQEVRSLKDVTQKKILPHLEAQEEKLGKVIFIETKQREQEEKMFKLYEVSQRLLKKLTDPK